MSKGYNKNGLYVDTGLLRNHISKLQEEKKLASKLYNNIAAMKSMADPAVAYQYDSALRDAAKMIEYFQAMAKKLAEVDEEAIMLSRDVRGMIENSTELNQSIVSKEIML